jgi:DNA repair exonuclease SbcCD ATPase subunit
MDILFVDTCLWMNLLEKTKFEEIFQNLYQLVSEGKIVLAVPVQLLNEFNRNKDNVAKTRIKSLSNSIKNLRNFNEILTGEQQQQLELCLKQYEDNLGKIQAEQDRLIQLSEQIFNSPNVVRLVVTEGIILNAAQRAIEKKWPFQKSKNSIGDAILYESIIEFRNAHKESNLFFVTDNFRDFSNQDNKLEPHDEIKPSFDELKITYSINLPETIEQLTNTHLSEEVKEVYHEYMGYLLLLGQSLPFICPTCNTQLVYNGYHVRHGVAGSHWACGNCGNNFLDIDENY